MASIWWKSLGSYAKYRGDRDETNLTIPMSTKMGEVYHEETHTGLECRSTGHRCTFPRSLGESNGIWELKGEAGITTPPPPSASRLLFAWNTDRGVHEVSDGHPS